MDNMCNYGFLDVGYLELQTNTETTYYIFEKHEIFKDTVLPFSGVAVTTRAEVFPNT